MPISLTGSDSHTCVSFGKLGAGARLASLGYRVYRTLQWLLTSDDCVIGEHVPMLPYIEVSIAHLKFDYIHVQYCVPVTSLLES